MAYFHSEGIQEGPKYINGNSKKNTAWAILIYLMVDSPVE